jgi:pantoate--beta-alanine ligase
MYVRAVLTVKELRDALESAPRRGGTGQMAIKEAAQRCTRYGLAGGPDAKEIGLVPTMGALHAGHEKLIETARGECATVVVSIFVNPIQFGPNEDYARYPRTLEQDLEACTRLGADVAFVPSVREMYPLPQATYVEVSRVSEHLCGKFRPGHFRGVATVVLKLLNIVQPDRAYFGEKDIQQLAVIRRMVSDLNVPVAIIGVPTVREADGLALSSRNQYLNEEERKAAPALYRALQVAVERIRAGERDVTKVRNAALQVLAEQPLIRVEYFEVVDPEELQPVSAVGSTVRIAAAVWIGKTRLIDNIVVREMEKRI